MSTFAVVINHGTFELTARGVAALMRAAPSPPEMVIVENGTGEGARLRAAFPSAAVLVSERNLGFSGGANLGIVYALKQGASRVLLANSDAVAPPDGLRALEVALEADPGLGIVGPLVVSPDGRLESAGIELRATGRMLNRGFGRRAHGLGSAPIATDGVVGSFMLVRAEVFEKVGGLDERYFYGFEDLDFCLRASGAGWRSACVPSVEVMHVGAASIGAASAKRLYYGARNHLLLLSRLAGGRVPWMTAAYVSGLHFAHAVVRAPAPRLGGLAAVARGIFDHYRHRHGP